MEDGGFAAMMHDLMGMDLGAWRPSINIPQTKALGDQKLQSLDPPSKFWLFILNEGTLADLIVHEGEVQDWHHDPVQLGPKEKDLLVAAYDSYLKRNRIMSVRATHKALVCAAKPFGLQTTRAGGGGERGWFVPKLPEMRSRFEKALGASDIFDT